MNEHDHGVGNPAAPAPTGLPVGVSFEEVTDLTPGDSWVTLIGLVSEVGDGLELQQGNDLYRLDAGLGPFLEFFGVPQRRSTVEDGLAELGADPGLLDSWIGDGLLVEVAPGQARQTLGGLRFVSWARPIGWVDEPGGAMVLAAGDGPRVLVSRLVALVLDEMAASTKISFAEAAAGVAEGEGVDVEDVWRLLPTGLARLLGGGCGIVDRTAR